MIQRRQIFDQERENGRRKSSRPAKICWVTLLSIGLCFAQLSPVFARRSFNSPVVPGYTSPHVARPAPPVRRSVHSSTPTRRSTRYLRSRRRSSNFVEPTRRSFFPSDRSRSVSRRSVRSHHFPVGRVLTDLPLGYAAIMLANSLYYYYGGSFYRRNPGGYVAIHAPVGAVVPVLPAGYSFLRIDGVRYYTHAGNYYLQVFDGYQIVSDPRRSVPQSVVSNKVVVTSNVLNVRSGPSFQHYIANRVYYGDVLQVLQRNVDWVYVQLPDKSRGWVMTRFIAPARQRVDG